MTRESSALTVRYTISQQKITGSEIIRNKFLLFRTYAKIAKKLNLSNRQDAFSARHYVNAQRLVREERREFVECA